VMYDAYLHPFKRVSNQDRLVLISTWWLIKLRPKRSPVLIFTIVIGLFSVKKTVAAVKEIIDPSSNLPSVALQTRSSGLRRLNSCLILCPH
jgi:hypothetical protein